MISAQPAYATPEDFGILKIPVLNVYRNFAEPKEVNDNMDGEELERAEADDGGVREIVNETTNNETGERIEPTEDPVKRDSDTGEMVSDEPGNDETNEVKEEEKDIDGVDMKEVNQSEGATADNDTVNECMKTEVIGQMELDVQRTIETTVNGIKQEAQDDDENNSEVDRNEEIADRGKVEPSDCRGISENSRRENRDMDQCVPQDLDSREPITHYSRPWMNDTAGVVNDRVQVKDCPDVLRKTGGLTETEEHNHEKFKCKSYNPEFEKTVKRNRENLMKFAEMLYKCKLCLSIPSILTSKESFLNHVKEHHLTHGEFIHICHSCSLKFRTEEDLKEHVTKSHTGSGVVSCDQTGNDIGSHHISHDQDNESNNDSDSDSSGHRQFRAKTAKRSKPVHDFENPKQLVDHTGIETWNGSLDLSKKALQETEIKDVKSRPVSTPKKEVSDITIKQITEQIIKSDVQCRNQNEKPGHKLPFIPSSTPEFGKYTKLVREGGNIVYFCQICNWKSPIKTTFQVHCNMTSHKNKVANAGNSDNTDKSTADSKMPKSGEHKDKCSNSLVKSMPENCLNQSLPWSSQDAGSYGQKFPDQSLFYNYIVQSRGVTQGRDRTPVVSPYANRNANVFQSAKQQTYKRSIENPVDLALKKKRRSHKLMEGGQRMPESDSDEDRDRESGKEYLKQSQNTALLRNKLFAPMNERARHFNGDMNGNLENDGSIDLSVVKRDINYEKREIAQRSSPLNPVKTLDAIDSHISHHNHYIGKPMDPNQRFSKCHACSFEYSKIEEYERHFDKVHKSLLGNMLHAGSADIRFPASMMWPSNAGIQSWMETGTQMWQEKHAGPVVEGKPEPARVKGSDGVECEMGENWRVQKLKELLPGKFSMME